MEMKVEFIRRWNVRYLADKAGGISRFAASIDRAQAQISHVIGRTQVKTIERKLARALEVQTGMEPGWLDGPHPAEWLQIRDADWQAELRRAFLDYGITVDVGEPNHAEHVELLTFYSLLNDRDKKRLVDIARVLAQQA